MSKVALICGVSGQDGSLLAKLLLSKGYDVVGQSRVAQDKYKNLHALGLSEKLDIYTCDLLNKKDVTRLLLDIKPDEIYNLSGQSSVGLSFTNPLETFESHTLPVSNILEVLREEKLNSRFFNAGSGECYGSSDVAIEIGMSMNPVSPYAVAKASAYMMVDCYREIYGLYVCTGVLFNHESPLRSERFVTQKVVLAALEISKGELDQLELGNLDIVRDWGWAEEYVEAMWLMLQQDKAEDFVIATGESHSLKDFVVFVFEKLGLSWQDYVVLSDRCKRKHEVQSNFGNPKRTEVFLNWKAKTKFSGMLNELLKYQCAIKRS